MVSSIKKDDEPKDDNTDKLDRDASDEETPGGWPEYKPSKP